MDRNVFLLTADSLHHRGVRHRLSQIQSIVEGVVFTNAIAPASETASAMPVLAAGVFADSLPGWGIPESGGPKLLFEVASEHGFETGLWSDNVLFGGDYGYDIGVSSGDMGSPTRRKRIARRIRNSRLERGFEPLEWGYFNVVQPLSELVTGYSPFYQSAEHLNTQVLDWLDRTERSVGHLCWVHYMDTHHPYEPPASHLSELPLNESRTRSDLAKLTRQVVKSEASTFPEPLLEDVRAAYMATCDYLADEIIKFVQRLVERGYFRPDRDLFVLSADHGEHLLPGGGMFGHKPPVFYEGILNVPLVVAAPDWEAEELDHQVSLLDLMPTVLSLADLPVPETVQGSSASEPTALHRDVALSVTRISDPDGWTVFRSARSEEGAKVFGRFDGEIVATDHHRCGPYHRESTLDQVTVADPDGEHAELLAVLDEYGGAIEVNPEGRGTLPEQHLRDLGYLE